MNLFQIIVLDVILVLFPILVYLIYLSTDKNITKYDKYIYEDLVLVTSFFLVYKYGANTPLIFPILVLNSIVALAYLQDKYILANLFASLIVLLYMNTFNYTFILLIIYVLTMVLYIIKQIKKFNNILFLQLFIIISFIIYYIWIYNFNSEYYEIETILLAILSYVFILNIIYLMYEVGKRIMQTHIDFKELQNEKQIRLSLFKITHEIKNPIAVCKGYLDMMNTKDTKQVERYIPIIKSEIERLLSLLQDFLFINKCNMDLDIMDLNMLVEDTLDKLNPILEEKNIKLETNIIDDEIFINGDYNRLSQVVINIIKNSIEAISNDRKGIINISSKIKNNSYYLIVEDNGIGMTKEIISKMGNPFFTTKRRGTGLGVSLIYEIMSAHHGKIEYESEYGKGTKVTLRFPLYE